MLMAQNHHVSTLEILTIEGNRDVRHPCVSTALQEWQVAGLAYLCAGNLLQSEICAMHAIVMLLQCIVVRENCGLQQYLAQQCVASAHESKSNRPLFAGLIMFYKCFVHTSCKQAVALHTRQTIVERWAPLRHSPEKRAQSW